MEQQANTETWTEEDEKASQALLDDQTEAYERRVVAQYASRDQSNLY